MIADIFRVKKKCLLKTVSASTDVSYFLPPFSNNYRHKPISLKTMSSFMSKFLIRTLQKKCHSSKKMYRYTVYFNNLEDDRYLNQLIFSSSGSHSVIHSLSEPGCSSSVFHEIHRCLNFLATHKTPRRTSVNPPPPCHCHSLCCDKVLMSYVYFPLKLSALKPPDFTPGHHPILIQVIPNHLVIVYPSLTS